MIEILTVNILTIIMCFFFAIFRAHDDANFVNSQTYLPPELQIAPPKKASTVGGGGVGSGLVKVTGLKSYGTTSGRGRGRRSRAPKPEVTILIQF